MCVYFMSFFFFNDTATTEIYTLSLHDALPISTRPSCRQPGPVPRGGSPARLVPGGGHGGAVRGRRVRHRPPGDGGGRRVRSEEHTSELQSRSDLVCRLLLEKKNKYRHTHHICL